MRIIISGANLTGLAYALLLNKEGHEVELFEKRPEADIEKLNSVIYLKEPALEVLMPYIKEELFDEDNPQAIIEAKNDTLYTTEAHSAITLKTFAKALRHAVERAGIKMNYDHELHHFEKRDGQTHATFSGPDHSTVETASDLMLLACGNKASQELLKKNGYKQPVELHNTHLVGTRMPLINGAPNFQDAEIASVAICPEYKLGQIILAKLIAGFFNLTPSSVGNFSLYLASLDKFVFMSTYPPERHEELANNSPNTVAFVRERLAKLRETLNSKKGKHHKDFTWLKEYENQLNETNVGPTSAFASVCVPEKRLYDQGVLVVGDGLVTSPFIYGSEFNLHVTAMSPILINYINMLAESHSENEKENAINHYIENVWSLITDKDKFGSLLSMTDQVGNTVGEDGKRVNMARGYKVTRETLERASETTAPWVHVPRHQQGGSLVDHDPNQPFFENESGASIASMSVFTRRDKQNDSKQTAKASPSLRAS